MTDADQQSSGPAEEFPKIGQPALRALRAAGYTNLQQLSGVSDEELLALHGFGPKALRFVRHLMTERAQPQDRRPG